MQRNSGSGASKNDQAVSLEPIAIVGIGCRFPAGAHDAERFWSMLAAGTDAISEVPKDRFSVERFWDSQPDKPGKSRSRWGGFVEQRVELFDALFFGMSPREAAYLDPMQRWLLEVSWEAFEDAGIVPERLAGSATAVFVGGFTEDIKLLQMDPSNRHLLGPHAATGSAMTMLANRLSYFYDLRGPSVALDTACSSSLVATHLACQSIWSGESGLALAGGVNAMFRAEYTIAESKAGMLSADGRSKAFDSRANGYVRGEGAGIVVLEPLSKALAAGRPIYAVIRGTAVNQDGHTNGITVPNGQAQQALIRAACERAGVSPSEIRYVEAHGTGTPVGDPIEVNALGGALSEGRAADQPCWIGSVKTNMGHLEAAAGIAGLIKASLVLSHGRIPAHLHLVNANPAIDFAALNLRVPDQLLDFPSSGRRLASVNSFGFGGTNAHVVLEAAPLRSESAPELELTRPALLTFSAQSEAALEALLRAHAQRWAGEPLDLQAIHDIAHSTQVHRSHHDFRLTVRAASAAELHERLAAAVAKQAAPGVVSGRRARDPQAPVFVFSGMGPQWWGMGQTLLDQEPVFRRAVEECDAFFEPLAGWSLVDEMRAAEGRSRVVRTDVAQPTSFALQVGLDRLWRSWGVTPSAIVGHSAGEVAAAYSAGVYCLEDAVTVIYHRSRLQQRTTGQGKLVALAVSLAEAREALREYAGRISIAAANGPRSLTLVGDLESLQQFLRPYVEREVFVRYLQVDVPYHSHYMDPLQDELLASLSAIEPRVAHTPLYSTVSGVRSPGSEWTAAYWWRNVRHSVLFAQAVAALHEAGHDAFLELGAHPVLGSAIAECFTERNAKATVLSSLRRKSDEIECLLDAAAALYVSGADLDWKALAATGARFVSLPFYPFQREEHWAESAASRRDRLGEPHHPLLGQRLRAPEPRFELELSLGRVEYLSDHVVRGNIVFPGAGYVEMMLSALRELAAEARLIELCEVTFHKALFLRTDRNALLSLDVAREQASLAVSSRLDDDGEQWQQHASATYRVIAQGSAARASSAAEHEHLRSVTVHECYAYLARLGLEYGAAFRGIRELHCGPRAARARVELDPALADRSYALHPALLDACFQVILAATLHEAESSDSEPRVYLPTKIRSLRVATDLPSALWVSAEIGSFDEQSLIGNLQAFDAQGRLVLELCEVQARSVENLRVSGPSLAELMYEVSFLPEAAPEPASDEQACAWLVLSDGGVHARALMSALEQRGQRCVRVRFGASFAEVGDEFIVDPESPSAFQALFAAAFRRTELPWLGLLHLAALDDNPQQSTSDAAVARAETRGPIALLHAIQALEISSRPLRISAVTRAVQPVSADEPPASPLDAALWGLLRGVAYQEAPQRFAGLFDLSWTPSAAEFSALVADLLRGTADEVAYRGDRRFVLRFVPKPELAEPRPLPHFRADGSYLITGGLGGLGMLVARFMVERGARRLILMGRSALPERSAWRGLDPDSPAGRRVRFILELEARGASVHVAALDVADEPALRAFLDDYRERAYPPIRGVVHAAGVSEPRLLSELTLRDYARTARPKVQGALLLDRLLGETLDCFVMFSSVAAFAFTAGQGDYAAANAVLDALAHDRRRRGLPALSINFGPWAEAGMATLLGEYFEQRGMTPFSVELGLRALGQLMAQDVTQATVLWISDPVAFRERNFSSSSRLDFLAELARNSAAAESSSAPRVALGADIFEVEDGALQQERALAALRALLSRVLRLELAAVDPQKTLNQLGLDSLLAVELKNRLLIELEVSLPVVELLRDRTIAELAQLLHGRLKDRLQERGAEPAQRSVSSTVPLGPNQHWFFARRLDNPHQWNMAALWEVTRPLGAEQLERAVSAVHAQHELLRARFVETPSGWQQRVAAEAASVPSALISLASLSAEEQEAAIERHIAERQATLHLTMGPLLDVTYFDLGAHRPGRLLTVIHHLVSDVFSQQVVVADLELACRQLESGVPIRLAPPSDGYGQWVQRLADYAAHGPLPEERRYWLEQRFWPAPLPVDFENGRFENSVASAQLFTASLGVEETRTLNSAAAGLRAHTLDLLLTAFAISLRDWSGHDRTLLDVIVHGREAPGQDMDLGRTVGLFAHGIPLALELPRATSLPAQLRGVQKQLAPFQAHARTFAALRWLSRDTELVSHLASMPKRELVFNYIGQFESAQDDTLFRVLPIVPRALEAADNQRDFLLQCQVGVLNGKLTLLLNYSENVHRRSSVEKLAQRMLDTLRGFARADRQALAVFASREAS